MPVFLIYSVGKGLFKLWYFWTFALFEKQMQNNFVWIVRNIEAIRMLLKRITWIRFQFKLFAIFVYVYIVLIQFRPMPNEINDAFVDYFLSIIGALNRPMVVFWFLYTWPTLCYRWDYAKPCSVVFFYQLFMCILALFSLLMLIGLR